ncbi:MAG: aspartate-semialdehyde dehydrogenase [Clostridia bacterium]
MKKFNVAIVGATGMVGRKMLEVLSERNLPIKKLYLYASEKSAGKILIFKDKKIKILELCEENIINKKIDFALFSAGTTVSKEFAPFFAEQGIVVIDNSSCFRMNDEVPLVVPEVNSCDAFFHNNIISNPNCSTIQAVVALCELHKKFKIKRIVYVTFQAVSGAGQQGYEDLVNGEKGIAPKKFPYPIYNNVLPHIDSFCEDGYTKEEHKMINETKKILHAPLVSITATTVRVPVKHCHSEAINVEFEKPCTLDEVKKILSNSEGIVVVDDINKNKYPMPISVENKNEVFVGRIRIDNTVPSGINLWVVADNIRKGAATNAVQILELLISKEINK